MTFTADELEGAIGVFGVEPDGVGVPIDVGVGVPIDVPVGVVAVVVPLPALPATGAIGVGPAGDGALLEQLVSELVASATPSEPITSAIIDATRM